MDFIYINFYSVAQPIVDGYSRFYYTYNTKNQYYFLPLSALHNDISFSWIDRMNLYDTLFLLSIKTVANME